MLMHNESECFEVLPETCHLIFCHFPTLNGIYH